MATTFDDLPPADQAQLLARLKVYGLDQTAISHPDLVVPGGATVHLAAGDRRSAVPARMVTTSDLDELKRWIGIPDQLYVSGKLSQKGIRLPPPFEPRLEKSAAPVATQPVGTHPVVTHPGPPGETHGPPSDRMANVHLATAAYLFGNSAEVAGYRGEIEGIFVNFQIPIWVFYTITVYPGATLQLTGAQNVLSAWRIVVYDGGTIAATGGLKTDAVVLEKIEGTSGPSGAGPVHVATPIGATR